MPYPLIDIDDFYNDPMQWLVGKTVQAIEHEADWLHFVCAEGRLEQFHSQDCCESVAIESIVGDLRDIIGTPILVAETRTSTGQGGAGSETWTFYTIRTIKGTVDIRWYGTSNEYYSESVDIRLVDVTDEELLRLYGMKRIGVTP